MKLFKARTEEKVAIWKNSRYSRQKQLERTCLLVMWTRLTITTWHSKIHASVACWEPAVPYRGEEYELRIVVNHMGKSWLVRFFRSSVVEHPKLPAKLLRTSNIQKFTAYEKSAKQHFNRGNRKTNNIHKGVYDRVKCEGHHVSTCASSTKHST